MSEVLSYPEHVHDLKIWKTMKCVLSKILEVPYNGPASEPG